MATSKIIVKLVVFNNKLTPQRDGDKILKLNNTRTIQNKEYKPCSYY